MSGKKTPVPFLDREAAEAKEFRGRMRDRLTGKHEIRKLSRMVLPKKSKREVHLVIGDSHANQDEPNHRFESLGRMIAEISPDCVVDIGDSADMSSLLAFESGSKQPIFEGHSYWRDLDSYHDARERLHHSMGNIKKCRLIRLYGNHEDRISRVLAVEPRFNGVIGLEDLGDEDLGWEVVPFLEPWVSAGIVYSHYFKAPGRKYPVAGVVPARAVILKYPGSFTRIFGHTHLFGFHEEADGTPGMVGKKLTAINCGCYFDPTMSGMRWAGTDPNRWRSGILIVEAEEGQIRSWRWYDFWDIQRRWGKP